MNSAPFEPTGIPQATANAEIASQFAVAALFLTALTLRVLAAAQLGPHIDEAESVMAARIAADQGIPLLPSGVLFLQGTTLTYLIIPFLNLSPDPLALFPLRLVSAAAGALAVPMLYVAARTMQTSQRVAVFAAAALTFDAVSIQWSAHVRPYALLQFLTLALIALSLRAVERPSRPRLVALSALFAFAVFTHVGVVIILPAMMLLTWLQQGFRPRAPWLTFASFAIAPLAFLLLNRRFGVTTKGTDAAGPTFIGDHLIDPTRLLSPKLNGWQSLFAETGVHDLMLVLVPLSIGFLVARRLFDQRAAWMDVFPPLAHYVLPITFVMLFTTGDQPRYLLHVHPLAFVLVGLGLEELALRAPGETIERRLWRALAGTGLLVVVSYMLDGTYARFHDPEVDPSYQAGLAWLVPRHKPGEPVISAMTSVTWLSALPLSDTYFLAGSADSPRATRYARRKPDGSMVDYWSGVPAITSTPELCAFLEAHPGTWIEVDKDRMNGDWALGRRMANTITGSSMLVHSGVGEARVYRSNPRAHWTALANEACSTTPSAAGDE